MYSTVLCITQIHIFHNFMYFTDFIILCILQFHISHNSICLTDFMYFTVICITHIYDLLQIQSYGLYKVMDYIYL